MDLLEDERPRAPKLHPLRYLQLSMKTTQQLVVTTSSANKSQVIEEKQCFFCQVFIFL